MTHRIFVGLQLPDHLHQQLANWRMQHADWPVRWSRAGDLHLTLVAPWEVESLQPAINAFQTLNGFFKAQTVAFDSVRFLHPTEPRMLWLEGPSNAELTDMKERLATVFERPAEEQAFRPHITLARCWPDQVRAIQDTVETVQWPISFEALVLYESKRDQFGSRYKTLATVTA